jgi:hypothetical protein
VSGLARGRTERIWLPCYVWVLTATAFVPRRQRPWWLLLSVVPTIGIEVAVRTEC